MVIILKSLSIITAVVILPSSMAIKCYHGQQNASLPVTGSPTDCPLNSLSCLKTLDYGFMFASRGCNEYNCTVSFY